MRKDLENKLFEKFDNFFKERHLPSELSNMYWGICCGDGWFKILWQLCEKLEKLSKEKFSDLAIKQVKEKFGSLRVYTSHDKYGEVRRLIMKTMRESIKVCEICGEKGKLRNNEISETLCDKCNKER